MLDVLLGLTLALGCMLAPGLIFFGLGALAAGEGPEVLGLGIALGALAWGVNALGEHRTRRRMDGPHAA